MSKFANHAALGVVAFCGWLAIPTPAMAEACRQMARVNLLGQGNTHVIARPDGQEMCFTMAKSAGLGAGRITVVTVRPVLRASTDEVEVLVTKERTRVRGPGVHRGHDFTTPAAVMGGARVFINTDDDTHLTVRVRPRHESDYRLAIIAHEIDIPQVLGAATIEVFAHIAFDTMMQETFGKGARVMPFLDERIQSIVLKTFFGTAKGHVKEQIIMDIAIGLALKQMMAGQDVPREMRIVLSVFLVHAWRELSKSALRPFQWPLPDHARDTSRPMEAALR